MLLLPALAAAAPPAASTRPLPTSRALAVSRPVTKPASRPSSEIDFNDAQNFDVFTFDRGRLQFSIPTGWKQSQFSDDPAVAVYVSEDGKSTVGLRVEVIGMQLDRATAGKVVIGIRQQRKTDGWPITFGPNVETDKRFGIRIHEKYKEPAGNIRDQLHLFRMVNGAVLLITFSTLDEGGDSLKEAHKLGEAIALSVRGKFNPELRKRGGG